jgi:hypothetical protein
VFNQFGDLERCALRPGNVHSADGWEDVLKPVVARYRGKVARVYFRADAGFANPEVYEYLEGERIKYAIRLPTNVSCKSASAICSSVLSAAPTSGKLDEAAPRRRQGGMASGRTLSARRLRRHQHGEAGREGSRLLQ